jgi:hypothetical protein
VPLDGVLCSKASLVHETETTETIATIAKSIFFIVIGFKNLT